MTSDSTCTCLWCRHLPFFDIEQVVPAPVEPQVRSVMAPRPLAVETHLRVEEANRLLAGQQERPLAVVSGKQLVGLVTEADLARASALAGAGATVETAIDEDMITVSPDEGLTDAVERMTACGANSALVVDDDRVVGVLARTVAERALLAPLRGAERVEA